MSLIKMILGKHNVCDYCFIEYENKGMGYVALALKNDLKYYLDIDSYSVIYNHQVNYVKDLKEYVNVDGKISNFTAKKLAKPYKDSFKNEFETQSSKKFYEENGVLLELI